MPLIHQTYGKARVRVMRVHRDGDYNEVRELTVQTMLDGTFGDSFTKGDNHQVVATDTIKNLTNIVAREQLTACAEQFAATLTERFLALYPQVARAEVTTHETKWLRATVGGKPHPHAFTLDPNGTPFCRVSATRDDSAITSGITGFTLMKTTQAGWVGYVMDDFTTLPETTDRIVATAMDATWTWVAPPADYDRTNAAILAALFEEFATTYSRGVQDSLFRMGEAVLAKIAEVQTISMACPNQHYLPINLRPFGIASENLIFTPTNEPHGQIECTYRARLNPDMDLNEIETIFRPADPVELPTWRTDHAPLAGGTWLFSEPQPGLRGLVDLAGLGWDRLESDEAGLRIGAMVTLDTLSTYAAPPAWHAVALFPPCVAALVGSFKVQHVATVGGNLCLALPASPMAALMVALDGRCTIRAANGDRSSRPALDFIIGDRTTILRQGELLHEIHLPASALTRRTAFRRLSLSPTGRSAALLIGTLGDGFALTVTASTTRPVRLAFSDIPDAPTLRSRLRAAIPDSLLQRDVHGDAAWRRHGTELLAEQIRQELSCA